MTMTENHRILRRSRLWMGIVLALTASTLVGGASPVQALQLVNSAQLQRGEVGLRTGFTYLFGLISPPPTFGDHPNGPNKASLTEEYFSVAYGLGDFGLKDLQVELRGTLFQSGKETVNGTLVHPSDDGGFITPRLAGNFIHTPDLLFGIWLQSDIPIALESEKFVKSSVNYIGGGLNVAYKVWQPFLLTQTLFVGSGIFSPNDKNPNLISSTLGSINFGQMLADFDFLFTTGLSIEADLTERTDAAYAASPLADGRIQNVAILSPFLLSWPIGEQFGLSGGYAKKWVGQSVRGADVVTIELSYKF